ncbi:MAG: hypothetical protein ABUL60_11975 [Myxococcales bacterium]
MPAYELTELRGKVQAAQTTGQGVMWNTSKTTDVVEERLSMTTRQARAYIYETLLALEPLNFVETKAEFPPPADVYGIEHFCAAEMRRLPWYVKFAIPSNLLMISFHPPTGPLRTAGAGVVR